MVETAKGRFLRITKLRGCHRWRVEMLRPARWWRGAKWMPIRVHLPGRRFSCVLFYTREDALAALQQVQEDDQIIVSLKAGLWDVC